jgi:hypothetical protein
MSIFIIIVLYLFLWNSSNFVTNTEDLIITMISASAQLLGLSLAAFAIIISLNSKKFIKAMVIAKYYDSIIKKISWISIVLGSVMILSIITWLIRIQWGDLYKFLFFSTTFLMIYSVIFLILLSANTFKNIAQLRAIEAMIVENDKDN